MKDPHENVDKMNADEAGTDAPVTGQACPREVVLRAEMAKVHHLPSGTKRPSTRGSRDISPISC